ncbi:hypothetical protein OD90_1686 [Dokdonia sp. Hel_I_53]|nr:hypothetical protein OD90_1686 [Dokdonia sp. Hel_I_53]
MKSAIKIFLFVIIVIIFHFLIELLYRTVLYSITNIYNFEKIQRMAIRMSSYHIVFNFFQIPFLFILCFNINKLSRIFFLNFLFVLLMCVFWIPSGPFNSNWYLKYRFSLSLSSLILFIISIFYQPRYLQLSNWVSKFN